MQEATNFHIQSSLRKHLPPMKRTIHNLPITIISLLLMISNTFAKPWPPYRLMDVPFCQDIVVDGILEDCYGTEQSTSFVYPIAEDPNYYGRDDFFAVFNLAYDPDYLYLFATLTDDSAENYQWGSENASMLDNIEWFVKFDTLTTSPDYTDSTAHLRINRGLDSVMMPGNVPRSVFQYFMNDSTGTGWLTEVAMPWNAIFKTGVLPAGFEIPCAMGFDFSASDADNGGGDSIIGNQDFLVFWDSDGQDGTEDRASYDVTVFGCILFECAELGTSLFTGNDLIVYPNPAQDAIQIKTDVIKPLTIFNIAGTPVIFGNTSGEVNVSGLKSGFYVIMVDNQTGWFVKR